MARIFVAALVVALTLVGQTRQGELEIQRKAHADNLSPEVTSRLEDWVRRFQEQQLLSRANYGYSGIGVKAGGLTNGSGFAVGPQYLRDDFRNSTISVRASAQISTRKYEKLEAGLELPKLASGKAKFDLRGAYRNYPGVNYYGPGAESAKTRSNYRLEDRSIDGALVVLPTQRLRLGGAAGLLNTNIGPGTDSHYVSSEVVFSPTRSPAIDSQPSFYRYGGFAQLDYRDDQFGPRSGGSYVAQFTRYEDRNLGKYSFNLLDVEVQQYVSVLNKSRVLALRAHTRMTDVGGGQNVPFYLQPIAGGPDDLRGFRAFRFSGKNSLVMNGEYRWAIFSGLDGAVFADAGKVFERRSQLNFKDLESSAGFGLRFNARNRTFLRFDVGFSHEGFQVWFRFGDAFAQRPLGTADSQPIL